MKKRVKVLLIILVIILVLFIILQWGDKRLTFGRDIETSLDPDVLWQEVLKGFVNSKTSDIWPEHLSTVHASSTSLEEGVKVTFNYHTFIPDREMTYTISSFRGNRMSYASVQGRFKETIEIVPTNQGSTLVWTGEYNYRSFSFFALFYRIYERQFFPELERKINVIEARYK